MMQLIIGLNTSFAECAKIVREFQKCSLSELKQRVNDHDYVLCYPCADDGGVKNIIKCYDKLTTAGAEVSLYELDHRPTTIEHVRNRDQMYDDIISIMDLCKATENTHFQWFERLLNNHFEGIIAHATYDISAGKIEGINNKIKTLRRQGYGYPDDEYFFLNLFDMSRQNYERNPKSHKICD